MATQVQQLVDMGFAEADAIRALREVNLNFEQAVERLLGGTLGEPEPPLGPDEVAPRSALEPHEATAGTVRPPEPSAPPLPLTDAEDPDLSAALELSMREQRDGLSPAPLERQEGLPCGLLNIGNTCYVNSLLQTLLHLDEFRERMLRYRATVELEQVPPRSQASRAPSSQAPPPEAEPEAELGRGEREDESRRGHCIGLATQLRRLFACSLLGARGCIDPSRLLGELVDRRGQKIPIGGQEDVGEFMLKLFEQLEEGLRLGSFIEPADAAGASEAELEGDGTAAHREPGEGGSGGEKQEDASAGAALPPEVAPAAAPAAATEPTGTAEPEDSAVVETADKAVLTQNEAEASQEAPGPAVGDAVDGSERNKVPSLLQSFFFGEQVQVFSYRDRPGDCAAEPGEEHLAESGLVVHEEHSDFLQVFLDVRHRDLYSAWDAANRTEVDYVTPSGQTTRACTSMWIKRLPKLLFFQLQRVAFDQERKAQVKLDDAFEFDTTIHADRFLLKNRAQVAEVARHVRELQRRSDEIAEKLAAFEAYQGRQGLAAEDLLSLAAECLERNASSAEPTDDSAVQRGHHPDRMAGAKGAPQAAELQQGVPHAAQLLRGLRDACTAQASRLRGELEQLRAELRGAHRDLQQQPFELYAIWVHQGIAGSGHYLAYLRDWPNDRWVRFDDALVSVVPWDDVRAAAVGQTASNASAYVLAYVEGSLALEWGRPRDQGEVRSRAEAALPQPLLREIRRDDELLREERGQREGLLAEQELRRHANAIFQHYAGLVHQWEPLKRTGDSRGDPHDQSARKSLHDPALLKFELFLYRMHGEQKVWTSLLSQSIELQRQARGWTPEDEGRVLHHLAVTLRGQRCYASMLRECTGRTGKHNSECELVPLDMAKLSAQYTIVLVQAHIVDEALRALKDDRSQLLAAIGRLAFLWANWRLENEDPFRQNEVLLLMSTLIYNTVGALERGKRVSPDVPLATFQPACEYFLLLLLAVEWPKSWKTQPIQQILRVFPQIEAALAKQLGKEFLKRENGLPQHPHTLSEQREAILLHPITQENAQWEAYEAQCPEPGEAFFERHRALYSWVMQNDESIAQEYVVGQAPGLRSGELRPSQ